MATHSSISCLENPHGQRSLAGYSPKGHEELDMTERLSISITYNGTEFEKEYTHIFFFRFFFLVQLKLIQHCKSATLQFLKIICKKKKSVLK